MARSLVNSPRVTPRPERSSRQGSISGQPPSAMDSDPFMPTGNSRPTSTRTTSPLLCSPRSKEDFYSPRCNGVPVRSKLRSIPSSPLPSADEPKPGSFTAIAEVGSQRDVTPVSDDPLLLRIGKCGNWAEHQRKPRSEELFIPLAVASVISSVTTALPRGHFRQHCGAVFHLIALGGDDGTRTHDPLLANKPTQDVCERLRTRAA